MTRPSKTPRSALERALEHLPQLDRQGLLRLAQKLSGERELFLTILQSLQDAVIVIDRWGQLELINPPARRLLGLEGKASPNSLWKAVPELAQLLNVGRDGELVLPGALTRELELHYPALRVVRLFAAPLQERVLIVLSDHTRERQASERQIEDARLNSLTQLSAGVAHELGNPLNALQIHLQLLERELKKLPAAQSKKLGALLNTSQGEVQRLDRIIRNFLQAIRPTPPDLRPLDAVDVLEEVLSFLHQELEGAGIRVQVELPGLLPPIMADVEQLKQVYFNLIKNAREATPSGGQLTIRARADDQAIHLDFVDTGAGIAQEDLSRLFEPYHTTKPGGTGLGLMIVQKIMRAHAGSVAVQSTPGRGTTVTLSFPRQLKRWKSLAAPSATPLPPKR